MPTGTTTLRVNDLHRGVSTQPAPLRLPGHVESATNAVFDVARGIGKRPGAEFRRRIQDYTSGDHSLRLMGWEHSADEKYVVIYGRESGGSETTLKVYTAAGDTTVLRVSTDAQAYLDFGDPSADQLVLRPFGKDVLIVNTLMPTAPGNYGTYATTATYRDYNVLTSNTLTDGNYYATSRDTPTVHAGYYQYDVDGLTFATWRGATTSSTNYTNTSAYWNDDDKNPGGFKVAMQKIAMSLSGVTYNHAAKTLTKTGAFAGYSHEDGDQIYVSGGTGATAGWYTIVSKDSADQITLSTAPGSGNQTDFTTTRIGAQYEATINLPVPPKADMYEIAAVWQQALRDAGCEDGLVSWTVDGAPNGYFTITGRWRGSGAAVDAPTSPTSGYDWSQASHPFNTTGGTATAGTGSAAAGDETKPVADRWVRVPASGSTWSTLDPTTMPVIMRRNGQSAGDKDIVLIETIQWAVRLDGDDQTNPPPSAIRDNARISDVAFHRTRLMLFFANSDWVAASKADSPYDLFFEDATNLVDSDPFELRLGGDKSGGTLHAIPFRQTLVIFTDSGQQFELSTPEVLTPETAAFTISNRYDTLPARPSVVGDVLYFAAKVAGGDTTLLEYVYDDLRAAVAAEPVSTHASGLLPTQVYTIAAHPNTHDVLLLGQSANPGTNQLQHFRAYYSGGQKRQAAWGTWEFPSGWKVRDVCVLGGELFMLTDDGSRYAVDAIPLARPSTPTGYTYYPHLDRWFAATGSYSNPTTTWTYPQTLGAVTHIVLADGTILDSASSGWSANTTTVSVTGNYSSQEARLGFAVDMSVEFTRPFPNDDQGRPDILDDLSVLSLAAYYQNTGGLTLTRTYDGGQVRTKAVSSTTPGTGVARLLAGGPGDATEFTATDTTPRPTNIAGIEWSCAVTTRDV